MFGFGTKLRHVFASRWKAASWSLGVLLTAYCSVPSPEQGQQGQQTGGAAQAPHKSPWSKN